jgi:hypothetical protein
MSLIRHCIIDTTTNKVVNVIDYATEQNGVPPALEQHLLCVKSNTGQISDTYSNGIFTPIQPYPSWTLVNNVWQPPVAYPNDGKEYKWNEENIIWRSLHD